MKSSVHIHRNRLIWLCKGQRVVLSLSEAQTLIHDLTMVLPALVSEAENKREAKEPIYELDAFLRSQEHSPEWLTWVHLEFGEYVPTDSMNTWEAFWRSIQTVEPDLLSDLLHRGAFDRLFKLDPTLETVQLDSLLSSRLREISEPMEWVGPSSFEMGDDSLDAWNFERPVHTVELTEGFWIGRFPVTQQLYWTIMGELPKLSDNSKGALKPIVQVSWWDALLFCNRLSKLTNREPVYRVNDEVLTQKESLSAPSQVQPNLKANGYRLPTEAEWECAAKAFQPFQFSGSDEVDAVAWTNSSSLVLPQVGMKEPNALGLHDMSGSVWEWCFDGYDPHFYEQSPVSDPIANIDTDERVCRGGSYLGDSINARVSLRGRANSNAMWDTMGFRIVCND